MKTAKILKMNVAVTDLVESTHYIQKLAKRNKGAYVCVSNVHMCMEAFDDVFFSEIINASDLTIPDGKPISIAQKALKFKSSKQVRGEDLTLSVCKAAEENNISIGFFGATDELLNQLKTNLFRKYPNLDIAYTFSPPYRPITLEEDSFFVEEINTSGINILFVGLGCPKQEIWMAEHKEKLNCVMVGVGAAFDFISGNKRNAPQWVQSLGLEWLFRMLTEPKRLWKRYLKHNPRFIWYFSQQLFSIK